MGWFDRAKAKLGMGAEKPAVPASSPPERATRKKGERPPLREPVAPSATVEDALVARAEGRKDEARAILAAIDKGQGLRTVLRAAAALEAGDQEELARVLPLVAREKPVWQLPLQVAASLEPGQRRDGLLGRAEESAAPGWALAWVRALSKDEATARAGLVDLLFEDAALARIVAARDLAIPGVKADNAAVRRYAGFAHGRDAIRRFGAIWVADLLDRIREGA